MEYMDEESNQSLTNKTKKNYEKVISDGLPDGRNDSGSECPRMVPDGKYSTVDVLHGDINNPEPVRVHVDGQNNENRRTGVVSDCVHRPKIVKLRFLFQKWQFLYKNEGGEGLVGNTIQTRGRVPNSE